jgi:hypothetical protein
MKNLIDILKEQTTSLKEQYILKTKEWATEQVQRNIERKLSYQNNSSKDYPVKSYYHTEQKWYYSVPSWHFTTEFIDRMVVKANQHYEDSIVKLADRIEKKGLDKNNIKVNTSHIGVNINTTLTDGVNTVSAYTIIASGEVQRPHYRYLIK